MDADSGYDNQEQIKNGVDAGMTPYVPLADKEAQVRQEGRWGRRELTFDPQPMSSGQHVEPKRHLEKRP